MTINQNYLIGQNGFYSAPVGKMQAKETTPRSKAALEFEKVALVGKLAKSSLDNPNAGRQNKIKEGDYIQRLKATNGQIVEFTYGDKKNTVMACILPVRGEPIYIHPKNLPKDLIIIQSAETFFSFFKNVSLRIAALNKGEYKLYVSGKLLGGMLVDSEETTSPNSYQKALREFTEHLFDLANPLLLQDILQKLSQTSQGVIDSNEGIENHFSDLHLPRDTLSYLREFSAQITAWATSQPDQTAAIVQRIKNDLSQLAKQNREGEYSLWEPLVTLFNIPQIRELSNDNVKKIIHRIDQGRVKDLRDFIINLIKEDVINVINKQLKKESKYNDIKMLLGQVIKKKPPPEGIVANWDQRSDFFENKTLSLTNPNTQETYIGIIVKCLRKTSDNSLIFHLQDQSEVHIASDTHAVIIIENHYHKLWSAIHNNLLSSQEIFEIELATEQQEKNSLKPGSYFISSIKHSSGSTSSSGSSSTIELSDEKTKRKKYILTAHYEKNMVSKIEIQGWAGGRKKKYIKLKTYTPSQLNRMYIVKRRVEKAISGINSSNADKQVRIINEKDEITLKLFPLNQLKKQTDVLRAKLMQQSDLLEQLIDNLASHQLTKVDWELLTSQKQDLAEHLTSISEKYSQHLKIAYPKEDILKELVKEVFYASLLDKEKNVDVFKTMELLLEAYQHIEKIKNKDVIFFVGNTTSGKSTAISYFLGVAKDSFSNDADNEVVRAKENEEAEETYSTLGQVSVEPEAPYNQVYAVPDSSSVVLADCPRFNDTRGEDHEILANLSIDLAVQEAKQIKAIVLVVSIHAFLADRANAIIDLIDTVKEKFPGLFNPDKPQDNPSVYLLITKQEQVASEIVEKLKDGTRIKELLEGTPMRGNIWEVINHMQKNKQVDFIDIDDACETKELLEKYEQTSPGIAKDQYVPAMQRRDMLIKFDKYVKISTDIWTHHIFTPYLQSLPESIQSSKNEIETKKKRLKELEGEIEHQLNTTVPLFALKQMVDHFLKWKHLSPDELLAKYISKYSSNVSWDIEKIPSCQEKKELINTPLDMKKLKDLSENLSDLDNKDSNCEGKKELQDAIQNLKNLINLKKIEVDIKITEGEKKAEEEKLQATEKRKRNLAIIIQTHKETAKLLRDFSGLVVGQPTETERSNQRNEVAEACQKFIKIYDENIKELEKQCCEDLKLAQ
ncbi:hypothetical protein DB42_CO00220 [Neochlamydia sp. EPS4]|uniref:hypothetical protein n=1 Tax=Neochlamydia sp. EPS4 TaxID=1478175 RepID=UPI0005826F0A|nr:hypothetical protein [Neochlamydia sp. EPS4]KIC72987.1 hypothetical protein DB42_CO00220 [Neochlamydia sp. EPS4]